MKTHMYLYTHSQHVVHIHMCTMWCACDVHVVYMCTCLQSQVLNNKQHIGGGREREGGREGEREGRRREEGGKEEKEGERERMKAGGREKGGKDW